MAKNLKEEHLQTEDVTNSKIEVIKNLIFGENIQEYNNEFESLKSDIAKNREEMLAYIDDARKEIMTALDNITTDVNIRVSDLEQSLNDKTEAIDNQKVSLDSLGDLLVRLGKNMKG
ncbi:hypothetical protein [Dokdonia donghaensis]|uniref:Fructose 1,6-bisphosphatase n=1 Tax=Dokdonia donghaensis DSW-1 TaxID=1300343 RepID=A0A0A2GW62_9FLAO|nr:hypothetical protein [Dokdonia donghaensis]ANH59374.1 hypothetical protein I597_0442 [Dokdonia donghaensis DSW-1]KGO06768.1 fructose 1,6-bisphosphatase [Dokdonia donghaensis DSW-1]